MCLFLFNLNHEFSVFVKVELLFLEETLNFMGKGLVILHVNESVALVVL